MYIELLGIGIYVYLRVFCIQVYILMRYLLLREMRTSIHEEQFVDVDAEYYMRYYLTSIPNPSDESDFEDTTYETDLNIGKYIIQNVWGFGKTNQNYSPGFIK